MRNALAESRVYKVYCKVTYSRLAHFTGPPLGVPTAQKDTHMKSGIHPNYHDASITCGSCGHVYQTKSTGGEKLTTEICGNCHPFYTGKQKLLDSAGRVDKFLSKYGMKK